MNRRTLLAALSRVGVLAAAGAVPAEALAQAPDRSAERPAGAAAFVQAATSRITGIVNGADSPRDKVLKLQEAVDQAVDAEEIARFCLGRFWRSATPAQQGTFLQMFHRVLLDGVTGQISAYQGVRVTVGATRERDDGTLVSSLVARPGQKDARVDWLVRPTAAGLRIEDVIAEGTSLRLTRRNDYAAYLGSHDGDIGLLLEAMRQRLSPA